MITALATIILTTFISVNGQLQEVEADSPEAVAYQTESETDIGNPENLPITESEASTEETATDTSEVSGGDAQTVIVTDNSEVISLLSDTVDLLAEDSANVTGTINSTIMDMMDRIIDDYPFYYKYAAFKVDSDDSYRVTLYISNKATAKGNIITFGYNCKAVNFYRTNSSDYSNYVYYDMTEAPNTTVEVGSQAIVYTNVLDGYPSLGTENGNNITLCITIIAVVIIAIALINRR